MEQNKIIIIVILGILILAVAGTGIYYLVNKNPSLTNNNVVGQSNNIPKGDPKKDLVVKETITPKEIETTNKTNFPTTITGIITLVKSSGSIVNATVKTSDGKTYTLSPDQPAAIYGSFGVKDGSNIQIQGKIIGGNKIEWVTLKAI